MMKIITTLFKKIILMLLLPVLLILKVKSLFVRNISLVITFKQEGTSRKNRNLYLNSNLNTFL